MSDKPQPASDAFSPLPGHRVLALSGRDAAVFAQAQCMNDVAGLAPGHWQWNGWLTPKGRVIALFALLKLDPQTLWLLLPDANADALAEQLRRYVFRSKVVLAVRDDLQVAGAFAAPADASGARIGGDPAQERVELDLGGDGGARTLRIAPANTSPDTMAAADAAAVDAWRAFDLAHGLPHLGDGQVDRWTPQQLSLDRLRAYSVNKGCYPGQEIVARTHFLGQAKRGLRLLETAAAVATGDALQGAGGTAAGEVVCVAPLADGRHLIQVVAPLEAPADAFTLHGRPASARAFQGGLARSA